MIDKFGRSFLKKEIQKQISPVTDPLLLLLHLPLEKQKIYLQSLVLRVPEGNRDLKVIPENLVSEVNKDLKAILESVVLKAIRVNRV